MALLELLNVEGDSQEESATVTETWYCEYSDVADRYALDYPAVGVPWNSDSSYIFPELAELDPDLYKHDPEANSPKKNKKQFLGKNVMKCGRTGNLL